MVSPIVLRLETNFYRLALLYYSGVHFAYDKMNAKTLAGTIFCFQMSAYPFENRFEI